MGAVHKLDSKKLKRDCFIALLFPVALLSLVQIGFRKDWSSLWMLSIAIIGAGIIGRILYQFFNRIEDMTWQEQLGSLIKRVSTPVIILNSKHEITFSNDSFNRMPVASLLLRFHRLPEMLASQNPSLDLTERCKKTAKYSEMLENLKSKIKTEFVLGENHFEWVLLPLFSPTGLRWGTLVECVAKAKQNDSNEYDDELPLSHMLEQLSAPFMFVSLKQDVLYANLSLKMLLIRHQAIISHLCPHWDIYHPTGDTLGNFLKLAEKDHIPFNELIKAESILVSLREEKYQLSFQPLSDLSGEMIGTIVLWQDLLILPSEDKIVTQAISQAYHPLAILDAHARVKEINPAMIRILKKNEEVDLKNFIDIVEKFSAPVFKQFCQALQSNKTFIFVAEHGERFCDWIINPIREQNKVVGYVVEIVYPSRQVHQGYEESLHRMNLKNEVVEKELKKFTNGIAKLNLYQKEPEMALDQFNVDDYHHPLLRNSAKTVGQLAGSLKKIHEELGTLRNKISSGQIVERASIVTTPLHEVNILSSSIARNVNEIRYDFAAIDQELNKLKNLIKEQKSLNQAYVKPIQRAIQSTEKALRQSLGYSETVTLVVHQLHEIHRYLTNLQADLVTQLTPKMAEEVTALLDSVKADLVDCKEKLCEMISEYDRLKESWRVASESLTSCLHLTENVEQASLRWNETSGSACEYSQQVEQHLQHLFNLTEKLHLKTASIEQLQPLAQAMPLLHTRQFDQVAIEMEENKKRAEDVLLEGIKKG